MADMLACFHKCCSSPRQGPNQDKPGIYIKSVVKGGAADAVCNTKKFAGVLAISLRRTRYKCIFEFLMDFVKLIFFVYVARVLCFFVYRLKCYSVLFSKF